MVFNNVLKMSPYLKFIENLWDLLEKTLQSAGPLHFQDLNQKFTFLVKILYWQCM